MLGQACCSDTLVVCCVLWMYGNVPVAAVGLVAVCAAAVSKESRVYVTTYFVPHLPPFPFFGVKGEGRRRVDVDRLFPLVVCVYCCSRDLPQRGKK